MTTELNPLPKTPSPDVIDQRIQAGEVWVTLAGVAFRVGTRRYGKGTSTLLRTAEGHAYRLVPLEIATLDGLTYAHDVTIESNLYHVFVAPPESAQAKRYADEPISAGLGAPVLLVRGEERIAVRRVKALDGRPVDVPDHAGDEISPRLAAEIARIAERRKVTPAEVRDYLIRLGIGRLATVEKHEAKRKKAKK